MSAISYLVTIETDGDPNTLGSHLVDFIMGQFVPDHTEGSREVAHDGYEGPFVRRVTFNEATELLPQVCGASGASQRGNVVALEYPTTGGAYACYRVVSDALRHECQELTE